MWYTAQANEPKARGSRQAREKQISSKAKKRAARGTHAHATQHGAHQNVRRAAVEERAVVADDERAAGKVEHRVLEAAQRVDVWRVCVCVLVGGCVGVRGCVFRECVCVCRFVAAAAALSVER